MLEEYEIDNIIIKFYNDYIVENSTNQKEFIDNTIIKLLSNK